MASTCYEITWLKHLLTNLNVMYPQSIKLYCDNKAIIHIALNLVFHEKKKHIEIDCHLIREQLEAQIIQTFYSKALGTTQFIISFGKLGFFNIQSNLRESVKERASPASRARKETTSISTSHD
jgi:Fe2+ transport system protein B